jgi:regulatory protein
MPESLRVKALRLLSRRDYSRVELQRKLAPCAESEAALQKLLDDLAASRQLSDARYAESRVNVRGRRYGNSRLAYELRQAGVEEEVIAATLSAGEDEIGRCQAVWRKKFGVLPTSPNERVKQQNFLRQRGFAPDAIRQALNNLNENDE